MPPSPDLNIKVAEYKGFTSLASTFLYQLTVHRAQIFVIKFSVCLNSIVNLNISKFGHFFSLDQCLHFIMYHLHKFLQSKSLTKGFTHQTQAHETSCWTQSDSKLWTEIITPLIVHLQALRWIKGNKNQLFTTP